MTPSGSVNVNLPLTATIGSYQTSAVFTLTDADLSKAAQAVANLQGGSAWTNFTNVNANDVSNLLGQLSGQLGQIATQVWTAQLPFVGNLSASQVAGLATAFQAQLTSQISTLNSQLNQAIANFSTAQDLAGLLAAALNLSAGQIDVAFDPTTNDLTYHVHFSYSGASQASNLQLNLATAQGTTTLSGGSVSDVEVTAGGTGYTTAPNVTFSGGGGTGATAHAVIANGAVTGIVIDNAGSGYTMPPTITIAPPNASLATATIGNTPLHLTPGVSADFTFGVDLSPIGRGWTMTTTSSLSSLNAGAGVRTDGTTAPDFQITLSDGSTFSVSLSGAQTVGDVINLFDTASGGKAQLSIAPNTNDRFIITDNTLSNTGAQSSNFAVKPLNGSYAAQDLGLVGVFLGPDGNFDGSPLSGDTLAKHFFIQNPAFSFTIDGAASQITGSADLGPVGIQIGGSGTVHLQGSFTLQDPTTGTAGTPITLQTISDTIHTIVSLGDQAAEATDPTQAQQRAAPRRP